MLPNHFTNNFRVLLLKKNIYIGFFTVGAPNGPGINEMDFILDVDQREIGSSYVYISDFADDFDIGALAGESRRIIRKPLLRDVMSFWQFIRVLLASGGRVDSICFRLGHLPFGPYLVLRLFRSRIRHVHLKTFGVGLCGHLRDGRGIVAMFDRFLFHRILKRTDSLDLPTQFGADLALALPYVEEQKIYIVPNGAMEPLLKQSCSDGNLLTLGYIGRFPEVRGGRQVLDTLKWLKDHNIPARAILTGNAEETAALREKAAALELLETVDFIGIVAPAALGEYLQKIDIGFSIVENAVGTSGQKLRQYAQYGCAMVYGNDEFFDQLGELKHIHRHTHTEDSGRFAINVSRRIQAVGRRAYKNQIKDWARDVVSYRKYNTLRLAAIFDLGADETHERIS